MAKSSSKGSDQEMSGLGKLLLGLLVVACFLGLGWLAVRAEPQELSQVVIPQGFQQLDQKKGVQLYRKDYPNGTPDFVQVVDFHQGAQVKLLHGTVTESRSGKGVYGGNDARIRSQALLNYWKNIKRTYSQAFCVTNGNFFYMPESPTRLALPLKKDGEFVTDGYAINEHVGKKLMLELWPGYADIRELTDDALHASSAPDILGGLRVDANKRIKQRTGRTFAGVLDADHDGLNEIVFIFNTRTALQSDAETVLKSFGAQKVMMLDGGGSTQLLCEGQAIIFSERLIPQAIAVIAGEGKAEASFDQAEPVVVADAPSEAFPADPPGNETLANGVASLSTEVLPANAEKDVSNVNKNGEVVALEDPLVGLDGSKPNQGIASDSEQFRLEDVLWVLLAIFPGALIVLVIASRQRMG